MFKKRESPHHIHKTVIFEWRTDFYLWLIAEKAKMEPVGQFVSAHRDECRPCMESAARECLENPLAVAHFLGSAYVWAVRQMAVSYPELTTGHEGGEPLFRAASAHLLRLALDERVSDLVQAVRTAPPNVVVDVINDAGTAYGIERTAAWTTTPEATPPPWVTAMDTARQGEPHPDVVRLVDEAVQARRDALATATGDTHEGQDHDEEPAPARGGRLVQFRAALHRWARRRPTPPDGGQGGHGHPGDVVSPVPSTGDTTRDGPPRPMSAPVGPDRTDTVDEDLAVGLVHDGAAPVLSLDELRRLVGDPLHHEATTKRGQLRALLWEHRGNTRAVQAAWRATHEGRPAPSELYKYAPVWALDVVRKLMEHHQHPGHVRDALDALDIHRTPAMDRAVDQWVATHGESPLRRVV